MRRSGAEEFIAVKAGELLFLGGLLLVAGAAAVGGEQGFNGGDFLRGLEAGQAVGLAADDEGGDVLPVEGGSTAATGGEDGFGKVEVFELALLMLAALL